MTGQWRPIMSAKTGEPTSFENKFILNPEEAAEFLGVSLRTIRYWVATRRIPYFHLGRFVRFKAGRPDLLLESGRVDPSSTNSRFQLQLQKGAEESSRVKRFN